METDPMALEKLTNEDSGKLFSWDGSQIPF